MPSTSYLDQLSQARVELTALLSKLRGGHPLDQLSVSPGTDEVIGFTKVYHARLVSKVTAFDDADFRERLIEDVKSWLHTIVAYIDSLRATGKTTKEDLQREVAVDRYNKRAGVLESFLDSLFTRRIAYEEGEEITDKTPRIVAELKSKSEREIFQVVSRTIPTSVGMDAEVTSLLYALVKGSHTEPSILVLVNDQNTLLEPMRERVLRDFSASQELRDFVSPYLSALIKKALSDEGVEAYDDAFRNTYFAVVNRVQNYYQTWRPGVASSQQSAVSSSAPNNGERQVPSTPPPAGGSTQDDKEVSPPASPTLAELANVPPKQVPTPPPTPAEKPQGIQGTGLQ